MAYIPTDSAEKTAFFNQIRALIPGVTNITLPDSDIENSPWLLQTTDELLELFPGSDSDSNENNSKVRRALQFKVAAEMGYSTRIKRQEIEQQLEEYDLPDISTLRSNLIAEYNKIIASLQQTTVANVGVFSVIAFGD